MAGTAPPAQKRAKSNGHRPTGSTGQPVLDDFEFTHNGETYTLPSFATLKAGLIRRVRNMDKADGLFAVIEEVANEDTLAAVDDMTMTEFGDMLRNWQRHAGVSLGESHSSST